jgi:PAS domain S-box-containing protein
MGCFEIEDACCVDEAFKKLSTGQYDAVISDYEMPQKNGLDFLKALREQNNLIPFVLFTGKGREDVAIQALNLGADRYLNKHGSPEVVYGELADAVNKTVERKKSAQLLAKSESKYRMLVRESLQGMAILQPAPLRLVFSNAAIEKIFGYSHEEFMSLSPAEIMSLVYPEDRAAFFSRMERRLQGEAVESLYEFRAVRKDGSVIWLEALSNRVEYEGQTAVQAIFLNIDSRKKTEEIVRKSEQRYRELANFLPQIVFETDLTGKLTFFNQKGLEITGFTREELEKGVNMLSFVVPEHQKRALENTMKALSGKEVLDMEYTLYKKNGTTFDAIVSAAPIISENKVNGIRGLVIDVTGIKKSEK